MTPQTQRIIDLARSNVRPCDIAKTMGIDVGKVYSAIRNARSKGTDIPYFRRFAPSADPATAARPLSVPLRLFGLLEAEAARRGKTPSETAQQLLEDALLKSWDRHQKGDCHGT